MGMLMHHTWLNQQKQEKPKAEAKPVVEEKATGEVAEETVPVRKQAGRRKTSK
jgi:hypothetical protein